MAIRYPTQREQNITQYIADSTINVSSGTVIPLENRTLVRINSTGVSSFDFTLEDGDRDGLYLILVTEATGGHGSLRSTGNCSLLKNDWNPHQVGHTLGVIWNAALGKWLELHRRD
jgi:hypothetical protein